MKKMYLWKKITSLCAILFILVSAAAFADNENEPIEKFTVVDEYGLNGADIINFKVRLYEMGFYIAGVGSDTLQSTELDPLTMAAVKLLCDYNPELIFYNGFVSLELYGRVMGYGDPLATPSMPAFAFLPMGSDNQVTVTKIQNRLNALGYDAAGYKLTQGIYDENMQSTVDIFAERNKFMYDRSVGGMTVELQELLFSDNAIPYVEETGPDKGFFAKIYDYIIGSTAFMGINLPNIIILAVGFAMLSVIAILMVKLFSPSDSTDAKKDQKDTSIGKIRFDIFYNDEKYVHYVDWGAESVRIGRATGNFPLNMKDESVSRRHCEIYTKKVKDGIMLHDFSSYGTKINGELCQHSQHILYSGDTIEIGHHRIEVYF